LIKACWQGNQSRLCIQPLEKMTKRIKLAPKQMPKPFSREEIGQSSRGSGPAGTTTRILTSWSFCLAQAAAQVKQLDYCGSTLAPIVRLPGLEKA